MKIKAEKFGVFRCGYFRMFSRLSFVNIPITIVYQLHEEKKQRRKNRKNRHFRWKEKEMIQIIIWRMCENWNEMHYPKYPSYRFMEEICS